MFEKYRHQIIFDENNKWVFNWFSNMIQCDIEIDGFIYQSSESYFQSQKATNEKDRLYIASLPGPKSKMKAKTIEIRDDWEEVKLMVMKRILFKKFTQQKWKTLLLKTTEPIIEWNNWNDKFWGVSIKDNNGQNHLGKILMEIREELKYKSLFKK